MRSLLSRLLGMLRSRAVEDDVREEVEAHLDMRAEWLTAQGLSPEDARREAQQRFGNRTLIIEEARAQNVLPRLESVTQDFRYGLRVLRGSPGFTALAMLMLALGLGLNAAMFSVFHQVLLSPLQFPDADRLYVIMSHAQSLGDVRRSSSGPDFRDYRDQNTMFAGLAATIPRFSEVWTGDGEPRVVNCAAPTKDFFDVMGIRPALGRLFLPSEFHDLHNSTLLISWRFWRGQLGGDPNVVGRTLRIENVPSTIVGVLPPMTDLYSDVDVWLKLTTEPSWPYMNWRANKFLDVVGRLKPGVSPRAAEQQLTSILRRGDGEPADVQVQLTPLRDFIIGPVRRQLDIVMAAATLVLVVTIFNTVAMLLARTIKRAPELAVRLGLGASGARIRRQFLVEGLLLSTAGGAAGAALAMVAIGAERRWAVPIPRIDGLHLSGAAVAASVSVVLLTSSVFTLLPGNLVRFDLAAAFRGERTQTGHAKRPFAALIVGEIACGVVLAVCAGLLLRSFVRIHEVNLGFEADRTVSAYLRTNYDNAEGYPFWTEVMRIARNLPGATAAAISDCVPSARANSATIRFAERANVAGREPATEACWISADYFRALGAGLVRGRFFADRDEKDGPAVAIINVAAARRLFPSEDPIGKHIAVSYLALGSRVRGPAVMREIVGIVSDFRQRAVDAPPEPSVYLPYTQDETFHVLNSMTLYVRSARVEPGTLGQSIRAGIQAAYPNQPVEGIHVLRRVIAASLARRTEAALLMTGFAALALVLCGIGIYGVVSYAVQQRTREFGIRIALGARKGDVVRDVLKSGGALITTGLVIGAGVSVLITGALSQLLFETAPVDPIAFSVAIFLLGSIGILACLVPALRAARIDPRLALAAQ